MSIIRALIDTYKHERSMIDAIIQELETEQTRIEKLEQDRRSMASALIFEAAYHGEDAIKEPKPLPTKRFDMTPFRNDGIDWSK